MHLLLFEPITNKPKNQVHKGVNRVIMLLNPKAQEQRRRIGPCHHD
jgi:hypothetical protein